MVRYTQENKFKKDKEQYQVVSDHFNNRTISEKKEAEITESDILKMMDDTIKEKSGEKDITVSDTDLFYYF